MLSIRCAQDRDFEALASIYAHHVLHGLATFEEEPPTADEMHARYRAVRAAGLPHPVAELDGMVTCYSYGTAYRPRPAYRFPACPGVSVAQTSFPAGWEALPL